MIAFLWNNNADIPLIENEVPVGNIKPSFATLKVTLAKIFSNGLMMEDMCMCVHFCDYIKVIVLHYKDIEHRNLLSETWILIVNKK